LFGAKLRLTNASIRSRGSAPISAADVWCANGCPAKIVDMNRRVPWIDGDASNRRRRWNVSPRNFGDGHSIRYSRAARASIAIARSSSSAAPKAVSAAPVSPKPRSKVHPQDPPAARRARSSARRTPRATAAESPSATRTPSLAVMMWAFFRGTVTTTSPFGSVSVSSPSRKCSRARSSSAYFGGVGQRRRGELV
jgi:hypothetical protein